MERFLYTKINKTPLFNVWLAYGATESVAMSSLGYLAIFKDLDLNPDIFVERIYYDTKITRANVKDVHCIGFSISFELDIFNIIKMLKRYNISLKASERFEDEPLIFAGGPVIMANPFPYLDFFDFIIIGEKIAIKKVMELMKKRNDFSRDEFLKKLSELEGVYVPKYKKEKIKVLRDNLCDEVIYTPILSDKAYFKDTFIVELERGCPKMCNFCLASWLNLPVRFVPYEKIIEAIDLGLKYTNKIALLGAYVAGHPDFDKIIDYISKFNNVELQISSLRADLADEKLIRTLVKCGQKTATVALEAGSQKLRDKIGKDLTNEQFETTILNMQRFGLKGAKIYTMIGLPDEEDKDIDELIQLIKNLKEKTKKQGNFIFNVSTSTFIPKAHTPYELAERPEKKILQKRMDYLKKSFHKMGVQFHSSSLEWDMIQSILSRYQESLADFLIEVVENGASLGAFKKVWREHNKKGLLLSLESLAKTPLNNIKALKWNIFDFQALDLKLKRQEKL